jgi:spore maturation protein CgeB
MKILVLNAGEEYNLGWSYKRAFEALGHETTLIDPGSLLAANVLWRHGITRRLLERQLIERFNRGWLSSLLEIQADMVWVGKGAWATPWLWSSYKAARRQTKLICYNADDPITTYSRGGNRPWVTEAIGGFDLYCTYKTALIAPLRERTAKAVAYIPFGWDPAVHPMQRGSDYAHDLLFVGNGDSYREEWLTRLVESPRAANWRVAVYGSWPSVKSAKLRSKIVRKPLVGAEMASVVARSKVSLNILRRQNEGSHNMRTFEVPGCGGLTASQYSKEQDEFFGREDAAIYFSGFEDAAERIEDAIRNDRRRETMRERASEIVADHTYTKRAQILLDYLA